MALAAYWFAQGGLSGSLIEIDRVDPLTVQFQVDVNTAELPELINIPKSATQWASAFSTTASKTAPSKMSTNCAT